MPVNLKLEAANKHFMPTYRPTLTAVKDDGPSLPRELLWVAVNKSIGVIVFSHWTRLGHVGKYDVAELLFAILLWVAKYGPS